MLTTSLNFTQHTDNQYIARQPIVDHQKNIFAYELLYRNSENNFFPSYINDSVATSRLLFNSLLMQEIESITNGVLVFINSFNFCSIKQLISTLDNEKIVVEIVERTKDIEDVRNSIIGLGSKKVKFALDDYDGSSKWNNILNEVEFIKLEVEKPLIRTIFKIKNLKHKYPNKKIIVERIEDYKTFRQLKHAGCDYFQGFFFSKPEMMKLNNIVPSKSIIFELIALSNDTSIDFSLIHGKIIKDVALSARLLRIANNHLKNKNIYFDSINQSITYLGEDTLRQFIMILAMSDLSGEDSPTLSIMSLARAKFIADMLNENGYKGNNIGYTVGLLSLLDVMLDQSFEELLPKLKLSPECVSALMYNQGGIGNLLLMSKMLEKGNWFQVNQLSKTKKWDMNHVIKTFNQASEFANSVLGSIL